jgi:hypothetical protein
MSGNFQFLNLANGGKLPRPATVERRRPRCFSFTVPPDSEDRETKKRSQIRDLRLCNQIADLLRAQGFDVRKAARGKPRGAVLTISVDKFKVIVMLDAKRLPRLVKCDVLTWTSTSRWRVVPAPVVEDGWERTLKALEQVLRQDLNASSLRRVTEDDLIDQEKKDLSALPNSLE